jgi:hypothetical protein
MDNLKGSQLLDFELSHPIFLEYSSTGHCEVKDQVEI